MTTLVGQREFTVRDDVVRLVPRSPGRVLDVGCGPGMTGEAIRQIGATEVWGIERDPVLAEMARSKLDHVIEADLDVGLPKDLPVGFFDGIIYADILEHLLNPWGILRVQRQVLRPGGFAIFSIPNVRHVSVLRPLLRGRWVYTDEGILSLGHIRFFTTAGMKEMITQAGYRIEYVETNYGRRGRLVRRISLGMFEDLVAFQRLFRAISQP